MISRRSLFGGFAGLLAAPAIVKAASLMPVKALSSEWPLKLGEWRRSRPLEEVIAILQRENKLLSEMSWIEDGRCLVEFSSGDRTGTLAAKWRSLDQ